MRYIRVFVLVVSIIRPLATIPCIYENRFDSLFARNLPGNIPEFPRKAPKCILEISVAAAIEYATAKKF